MAVDTVLSKERSQNIAAQLNPDTTQSRVQQTRVSTRLVTQPRPDCSRLVSRLVTRVRLEKKKKKSKSQDNELGPERGGVFFFLLYHYFAKCNRLLCGWLRETGETSWVWSGRGCICVA